MKHPEGLRITLLEEGMLDGAGILKSTTDCAASYGLSPESLSLFVQIAATGEVGLPKANIDKSLVHELSHHLLPLEMQNLVEWGRDNRGRLSYLMLTWKGLDVIAAARHQESNKKALAECRRAAIKRG